MKIIEERPIDNFYMMELKEIAEWYEEDIDFALKQAIGLTHSRIEGFKDRKALKCKKEEI